MSGAVDQNIINITLCVLEVTGLAVLAVSRSLMRPARGHFFLGARLVSVTSRSTGADCTLANFFANISNIAAANIALEGDAVMLYCEDSLAQMAVLWQNMTSIL